MADTVRAQSQPIENATDSELFTLMNLYGFEDQSQLSDLYWRVSASFETEPRQMQPEDRQTVLQIFRNSGVTRFVNDDGFITDVPE